LSVDDDLSFFIGFVIFSGLFKTFICISYPFSARLLARYCFIGIILFFKFSASKILFTFKVRIFSVKLRFKLAKILENTGELFAYSSARCFNNSFIFASLSSFLFSIFVLYSLIFSFTLKELTILDVLMPLAYFEVLSIV